jgi:hypothetical protein
MITIFNVVAKEHVNLVKNAIFMAWSSMRKHLIFNKIITICRCENVVFLIFILTHPSLAMLTLPLSTLVERGEAACRRLGVSE